MFSFGRPDGTTIKICLSVYVMNKMSIVHELI